MSLLVTKSRRLIVLALVAMGFAGGHSGSALALTCTPPVSFSNAAGFDLGCASPALWSVLSINATSGHTPLLQFSNGGTNGDQGATGNVGAYAGVQVAADASSVFAGNIVVQTGTNTTGVDMTAPPNPTIVVDNALLTQARADALTAATSATALATNALFTNKQSITTQITNATTIYAKQSGLNVIQLTAGINLSGLADILTFSAIGSTGIQYTNVEFVINITSGNFTMANQAKVVLAGGIDLFTNADLLFNVQGAQTVALSSGSQVGGIILDVGGAVYMDNATVFGEVIGGQAIGVWNNSRVTNNSASQQTTVSGCTVGPTGEMTCVIRTAPEPGTIALLILGLLGIFGASMRRSSRPLSTVVAA